MKRERKYFDPSVTSEYYDPEEVGGPSSDSAGDSDTMWKYYRI